MESLDHGENPTICAALAIFLCPLFATIFASISTQYNLGYEIRYSGVQGETASYIMEPCTVITRCSQGSNAKSKPALWKLQEWMTSSGMRGLHHLGLQLPDTITRPGPHVLLASWLGMTLATFAYCELRSGHNDHTLILLGSVLVGIIIGIAEGSSADIIILTSIPWCLALGMLMDCLIHCILGVVFQRHVQSTKERQLWKEEKQWLA